MQSRGGGIAGSALAAALGAYEHLEVHVYEAAATFAERGAQVGIGRNGLIAMRMMREIDQALHKAGAVPNRGNRFIIGSGPRAGDVVWSRDAAKDGGSEWIVHRAAILRELLAYTPEDRLATGKRTERIEELSDIILIHFDDGTCAEADVLIGADGIHGPARSYVLGPENPATKPVFAGYWDSRVMHPREKVAELLGAKFVDCDDSRQHDFLGSGLVMLHDVLDSGTNVGMVFAVRSNDWPIGLPWKQPLHRAEVRLLFNDWPQRDAIVQLFCNQPEPTKFAEWVHLDATTYTTRRVALVGDAAHAMSPFQASGATQSLEDALVLSTVLGAATGPHEVPAAIMAYDAVRRPRSQAVAASSLKTAEIATGGDPDVGLDPEKLRQSLKHRWDFIMFFDLKAHCQEALDILQRHVALT